MKERRFFHPWVVFCIFLLCFVTLGACFSVYSQDIDKLPESARVHEGGTLTVACPGQILTLDPQKAELASEIWIIEQTYDGLLEYDTNDRIIPVLASAMPERLGENEYILRLKPGIEFHDGTQLDANDVIFTLSRLLDPTTQCPTRQVFQNIKSADIVAPLTIRFTLGPGCPDLLELLARPQMRPLSRKAIMKYGALYGKTAVIGTGPFRLIKWDREKEVILERNYSYKLTAPFLHRIIFSLPKPGVDLLNELRHGRLELISNLSLNKASEIAPKSYVRLEHKAGQRICQIYLNLEHPTFNRPNVRRAVSLGINRQEIAERAYHGFATTAGSCLPPWHRFFNPDAEKPSYDPNLALEILRQEGFTADFPVSFALMYTNTEPFDTIAQIIKKQLSFIGIQVHLIPLPKKDLFDFVYGRAGRDRALFQAALEDWEEWRKGGGVEQFTWRLYHHLSQENKLGTFSYPWEEDLALAVNECNPEIRELLFKRSASMIDKEIVTIYLCYPHRVWVARNWVNGEFFNSLGNLFLDKVWVR